VLKGPRREGSLRARTLADGTRVFELRFRAHGRRHSEVLHERRGCRCCGGGWTEPRARVELQNTLVRVAAGIWTPRHLAAADEADTSPWRFDEYATHWLGRWASGALGEDKPQASTIELVRDWALRRHLLPVLGALPLDDAHFTRERLTGYKAQLLERHDELERLRAAGQILRRPDGRPERLSKRSIQILLRVLAQILDEAVEDGRLSANHARSKRMRVRVPKPIRTWLQPDELSDLLTAVALVDAGGYSPKTARVMQLRDRGEPLPQIAERVGLSVPTVYYHLAKPAPDLERVGEGRALLTLLGYGGLRIGEALALRWRDVRLHAAPRRLDVRDAKTPTGVREVHLSPELADVLIRYRDARSQRSGRPSSGEALLWPSRDGRPRSRTWALAKVHRAADVASETRARRELRPLPNVTPHTLRHTYISILLLVTDNVLYVMEQVGHEDQDTTNRIYRHLIRQRQQHGAAFDRVVAEAREALGEPAARGAIGG
jgi:integrase